MGVAKERRPEMGARWQEGRSHMGPCNTRVDINVYLETDAVCCEDLLAIARQFQVLRDIEREQGHEDEAEVC